jgi:hypothetical protein
MGALAGKGGLSMGDYLLSQNGNQQGFSAPFGPCARRRAARKISRAHALNKSVDGPGAPA